MRQVMLYGVKALEIHQESYVDEEELSEELLLERRKGKGFCQRSQRIARMGVVGPWLSG